MGKLIPKFEKIKNDSKIPIGVVHVTDTVTV